MVHYLILSFLLLISVVSAKVEYQGPLDELPYQEAYELLVAGGYDPGKISNGGDTVLHNAVKKQDFKAIKLATIIGIDPLMTNKAGDTCLHLAAMKGDVEAVKYLVEILAVPITWTNHLGQTPYHKALAKGHKGVMDYLVGAGYVACDGLTDRLIALGYSPGGDKRWDLLIKIISANDIETFMLILNKQTVWDLEVGLQTAAEKGKDEIARIILAHGGDALFDDVAKTTTIVKERKSTTPFTLAAKNGHTPVLKILLESSPYFIDQADEKGNTALYYAVLKADLYMVHLLLKHGADVNKPNTPEWKRGSIASDFWSPYDWEVDAEVNHFNWRETRQEGWVDPLYSPLSLALAKHPANKALVDLLQASGAKERYEPSAWGK